MSGRYRCFSNLDETKREEWPDDFAFPPRIGDRVEAASGRSLKVVGITHKMERRRVGAGSAFVAIVIVELHKGGF